MKYESTGKFRNFELGLYEVLMHSQSTDPLHMTMSGVTFGRREEEISETKLSIAADGVSRKMMFSHLHKCLPEKSISI